MDYQVLASNKIAADIYHRQLRADKAATLYCKSRGIHINTLKKYNIGYAKGNIVVNVLRAKAMPYLHLASHGGDDLLKDRIIIPNIILGNIAMFVGRAFPDSSPKYLYSRGSISLLFNEGDAHNNRVVVVESPICALTLAQYNIPSVAKFGTGYQLLSRIPKDTRVYLMPDREKSNIGVIDSIKCAAWMYSEGYPFVKIALLDYQEDKVDPNSYMLSHNRKDLLNTLASSLSPEEVNNELFETSYKKFTQIVLTPKLEFGNDVSLIKKKVLLTDIIEQYTSISKRTSNMTLCACPFHQETSPSLYIYNAFPQSFFCFGCRVGGDVISFVQRAEGLTFTETINKLKRMI